LRCVNKLAIHFLFNAKGGCVVERLGGLMRLTTALAAMALPAVASPAAAATIVILTDPMTMERRTVVVDPNGPDRAYLCMLPPGQAGCQRLDIRRGR
jgi:hypothetical protein